MKKLLLMTLFLVLCIGLVLAVEEGNQSGNSTDDDSEINDSIGDYENETNDNFENETEIDDENETEDDDENETDGKNGSYGIGQELSDLIRERKEEIKAGEYNGSLGQLLQVKELVQGLKELRVNGVAAETELNITAETDEEGNTNLTVKLNNGRNAQIKIMPDTAAERALERLRLKVCSTENNCTIQLKDVGSGSKEDVSYEIQIQRHSRILGIFQKKMQVSAEVDAETGEVSNVKKPWWAFIATEPSE